MSLDGWKAFFEIGGITLLFLTFVFGAGALLVGKRINVLQDKLIQAKDEQIRLNLAASSGRISAVKAQSERDKRESDEKIANLNAETAKANEEAERERL